jgi:hypothetical protein
MNIPYLSQCLETDKFSDLVGVMDMVALDMNLAIEDAIANGEVKIDRENDKVEILVEATPYYDPELMNKLLRTVQHYAKNETTITRGRMNALVKDPLDPTNARGYRTHEYIMSMQYLIDSGQVTEDIVDVVKSKKYPAHKFVFLGLPENKDKHEEWNAKAVNKWIADFEKVK